MPQQSRRPIRSVRRPDRTSRAEEASSRRFHFRVQQSPSSLHYAFVDLPRLFSRSTASRRLMRAPQTSARFRFRFQRRPQKVGGGACFLEGYWARSAIESPLNTLIIHRDLFQSRRYQKSIASLAARTTSCCRVLHASFERNQKKHVKSSSEYCNTLHDLSRDSETNFDKDETGVAVIDATPNDR